VGETSLAATGAASCRDVQAGRAVTTTLSR
jgi:hypothetical protein